MIIISIFKVKKKRTINFLFFHIAKSSSNITAYNHSNRLFVSQCMMGFYWAQPCMDRLFLQGTYPSFYHLTISLTWKQIPRFYNLAFRSYKSKSLNFRGLISFPDNVQLKVGILRYHHMSIKRVYVTTCM